MPSIKIKTDFSKLLLYTTNSVEQYPPRKLANLLSCHDSRFSSLTQDCIDTYDVIAALRDNITFIDYDLLQFIAEEQKDNHQRIKINKYKVDLNSYLLIQQRSGRILVPKEMCVSTENTRFVNRLKTLLKPMGLPITVELEVSITITVFSQPLISTLHAQGYDKTPHNTR